jgi:LysR family hydrogen peroxide-inducible transcriptional activator
MNLQQLEYIVAVDRERHFVKAAESCFITQATLSAMIKKLEEELSCTIFDRNKKPVEPTTIGQKIIDQAKVILRETRHLEEYSYSISKELSGVIRLGIIPTMAPYVLPIFLKSFLEKHPKLHLKIKELTTDQIISEIHKDQIDIGILATPLGEKGIKEIPLFYEEFVLYASDKESILNNKTVHENEIDHNKLWILEEGHCLRAQVINFCRINIQKSFMQNLEFEAGNLQTLINLVDENGGYTILPELAIQHLQEEKLDYLRYFEEPQPVREVSLVTSEYYSRSAIVEALSENIKSNVPSKMFSNKSKYIAPINE